MHGGAKKLLGLQAPGGSRRLQQHWFLFPHRVAQCPLQWVVLGATVCAGCVLCWCAGGISVALWCCRVVLCRRSDRTVLFHMHGSESTMHLGTSLRPLCAVQMLCCCGEEAWRRPTQVENSTVVVRRGLGRFG